MATSSLRLALALGASLLLAPPAPAPAAPDKEKGGVFPEVVEVTKEDEAKALIEALQNAVTLNSEAKVLDAIKPMVTKRHKSFVADLKKLVSDKREKVAAAAAEALGSQGDKTAATLLGKVVSLEQRQSGFLLGGLVKAAAIESLGRLGVSGSFDAIQKLVQSLMTEREMTASYGPALLRASVRYFGLTKEKRAVSFLIDNVEEPFPENVGSGTNPPESYWKARNLCWQAIRHEVAWALKEITGKEFETRRRWKGWFEDEGKKSGMK